MSIRICNKCNVEFEMIYQTEFLDICECPICKMQKTIGLDDCCRDPFKIVIIDRTKKVERLLFQCKNCGGIVNKNLPLSFKKYREEIRDELNEYRYEEWKNKIHFHYLSVKDDIQENNFWNSKRGKYIKYLSSEDWKKVRELVLKRDENKCQKCKTKNADEVHHLTYENLFNEKLEDLISVCHDCHKKIHEEQREQKLNEILKKK